MKRRDQIKYVLDKVWEENHIPINKLRLYCTERGIIDQSAFEQLISYMEKKGCIILKDEMIESKITKNDYKKLNLSDRAFTFVNGGSKNKMVYTPPNTSFTSR